MGQGLAKKTLFGYLEKCVKILSMSIAKIDLMLERNLLSKVDAQYKCKKCKRSRHN